MSDIKQTVFIVDDDLEIGEMLRWLIESIGVNVEIYTSGKSFLNHYNDRPGCLILDVRMKDMSGFKVQETLIARGSNIPIIFITGHGDIPMAIRAMKNGAIEFLIKPFYNQSLLEIVQHALEQNFKQQDETLEKEEAKRRLDNLTPREYEVMIKMMNGELNRIMADKLKISISTIETHRAKVMSKMQVDSLAKLIQLILKHNLVQI